MAEVRAEIIRQRLRAEILGFYIKAEGILMLI